MKLFLSCMGLSLLCICAAAQEKRAVTASDCVQTRRVARFGDNYDIRLSPDGTMVAYVLKEANIAANYNEYKLFVRDIAQTGPREKSRLLFQADSLSRLRWLADSRRVVVLNHSGGQSQVTFINVKTGERDVAISRSSSKIWDYSTDGRGEVIALAVPLGSTETSRPDSVHGYAIKFREPVRSRSSPSFEDKFEIFLLKKNSGKKENIKVTGKYGTDPLSALNGTFDGAYNLSVSPNGRYLTFSYHLIFGQDQVPDTWRNNTFVHLAESSMGTLEVLCLYDIAKRELRFAIDSPWAATRAVWSEDSLAYFVPAVPPIHSDYWNRPEIKATKGIIMDSPLFSSRLYTVDVKTGSVTEISPAFASEGTIPLSWKKADGELIVPAGGGTFLHLARQHGSTWRETGKFVVPFDAPGGFSGNDRVLVGTHETSMSPPALLFYDIEHKKTAILSELNPEFQRLALGAVEKMEWANKYGSKTKGYLIKPVGYEEGKLYPLVILAYGWGDEFVCDGSGSGHTTAFPPQLLANAGFLVLLANNPSEEHQPKDYPGDLGEAYNFIEMIKGAVVLLGDRGMADPNNVGLIGWSRTSWKTDFLLTHSDLKLAAASSADSGIYNYGEYWLGNPENQVAVQFESMLGGPPYGTSFLNWLKYAPAFGAENVKTPLLMEYMSVGGYFSDANNAYEFFTALNRQGKPVELYFYPHGEHALDTPGERIASLQRNVDWFRFWMQGYEGRPPSYDPDQYMRWRKLRELYLANEKKISYLKPIERSRSIPAHGLSY